MSRRPLGRLRIIAGEWRSRLIDFDAADGVRPTPDRVRQTLFDWLAPDIAGARCLDLFAGSGALGLEALSRGAAYVTFVESGTTQAAAIRVALEKLGAAGRAEVLQQDALAAIAAMGRSHSSNSHSSNPHSSNSRSSNSHGPYDIAFVDPPFDSALLAPALAALPRVLAPGARVYAERHSAGAVAWPANYAVIRDKKTGQVSYVLATHRPEARAGTDA